MSVFLSPVGGAGAQFFDNNGNPLTSGKLYTYQGGTTTPQATYTTSAGNVAHTNPIVLDSAGRVPSGGEIWVTSGASYKFVLETALGVVIATYDNLTSASGANTIITPSGYTTAANVQDAFDDLGSDTGGGFVGFKAAGANATSRTVLAKLRESVTPQDYGAVGNGVANDSGALFNACAASSAVHIPAGSYLIPASISFGSQLTFDAGAKLVIPTGVTVTFTGEVVAGVYQIFQCSGTGKVVFNWNKTDTGYPEWWGAVPNDAGAVAGNVAAINASLVALRKTQLLPADYWVNARLYMGEPWRELSGSGEKFGGSTSSLMTRILSTSATENVLQVGPDTYPGSINALYQGNKVNNVYLGRTVAPSINSACVGLKNIYTLYALFENVTCAESMYGWEFYGTVQTQAYRCWSFRSVAGSGAGTDTWRGYYINGYAPIAGLNSGNASVYLNYCNAQMGVAIATSAGFYLDNRFTDAFLESPESTGCETGIFVLGNASNTTFNYENGNLQIKHPVMDAFTYAGIWFKNLNKFGSAEVIGGYYGASAGSRAAVAIDDCLGAIRVSGGQAIMVGATSSSGFSIVNSTGLVVDGTIVMEAGVSGIDASGLNSCVLKPVVKNYNTTSIAAAVRILGTNSRNYIAPLAYGAPNVFPLGVQLVAATNTYTEINCTGLDPAAIAGGSGNKLVINGVQITAAGLTGNNLASGVMN